MDSESEGVEEASSVRTCQTADRQAQTGNVPIRPRTQRLRGIRSIRGTRRRAPSYGHGKWTHGTGKPVKALSRIFRAKFRDALRKTHGFPHVPAAVWEQE